jgi:hypothetical protein
MDFKDSMAKSLHSLRALTDEERHVLHGVLRTPSAPMVSVVRAKRWLDNASCHAVSSSDDLRDPLRPFREH